MSFSFRHCILLLSAVFICGVPVEARKRRPPLPQTVLDAKTVYLDNRSGFASIGDKAYDELMNWGRFRMVQNRKNAEIILLLSATEYRGGYVTTSRTEQKGHIDDYGNIQMSGETQATTEQTVQRRTHLTVIDPKSGENLWSNSKQWGNLFSGFRSATRGLIKDLQQRIEEQESASRE